MLARNMGHKHYGIWNDTFVTYPDGKWFEGVNGGTRETFHGSESSRRPTAPTDGVCGEFFYSSDVLIRPFVRVDNIPVHGPTVANIVRKRLTEDI